MEKENAYFKICSSKIVELNSNNILFEFQNKFDQLLQFSSSMNGKL